MGSMFYLFLTYAVIWTVLFAYTMGLSRRQEKLLLYVEELKKDIRKD